MPESTFFDDLLAAQKAMPHLQKSAINPHFKNRYVPLEELLQAVIPVLNEHNFVLLQMPSAGGCLQYQLLHKSGESAGGMMDLCCAKDDPQGQGSAITYARRYSLMALLGLTADVDDDAEATRKTTYASERPAFKRTTNNEPGHPDPPCPEHGMSMKLVPAGTSKKSGKPYSAFYSCEDKNCEAGKGGRNYTIFEDEWVKQIQLSRGGMVEHEDMDVPFNE